MRARRGVDAHAISEAHVLHTSDDAADGSVSGWRCHRTGSVHVTGTIGECVAGKVDGGRHLLWQIHALINSKYPMYSNSAVVPEGEERQQSSWL